MSIFAAEEEEQKASRLKLKTLADLERFARRLVRECYRGDLAASRARVLSQLVRETRMTMESASLEARLAALEEQPAGGAAAEVSTAARERLRARIARQLSQREHLEQEVSGAHGRIILKTGSAEPGVFLCLDAGEKGAGSGSAGAAGE